jgi:small subunit ribosomal protein S16
MIKLRFKKYGRKGRLYYRIVAMDSRTKRDGASIEELGFYNPITDETHLKFQHIKTKLK